nr:hypothetical protein [uncultured Blautia sp.]
MTYEVLLNAADQAGLTVKEKPLSESDGLIKGNRIAIRKDIPTQAEKSCVLAEELGHYFTSAGNILDQTDIVNRKQEYRARLYGYNLQIGLRGIISAHTAGCRNLYEMADYLDITEEYLKEALDCYQSKYGEYVKVDNYMIYFIPSLAVLEITDNVIYD